MSLKGLFEAFSLSPWCDDLSRDEIDGGQLTELVDKGVRVTQTDNFARAVSSSDACTKEIRRMTAAGAARSNLEMVKMPGAPMLDFVQIRGAIVCLFSQCRRPRWTMLKFS